MHSLPESMSPLLLHVSLLLWMHITAIAPPVPPSLDAGAWRWVHLPIPLYPQGDADSDGHLPSSSGHDVQVGRFVGCADGTVCMCALGVGVGMGLEVGVGLGVGLGVGMGMGMWVFACVSHGTSIPFNGHTSLVVDTCKAKLAVACAVFC